MSRPVTARSRVVVDDIPAAIEALRLARMKKAPLSARELLVRAPSSAVQGTVVVDADNGLADVDARLSLRAVGHALARLGYTLPLLRPWSSLPLWRLVMTAPFVVDALVQRGAILSIDGDAVDAPRAPRHAAGPSMVHAVCGLQPLALLARATLRVVPKTHAHLVVTDHGSVEAAVAAFVAVTNSARGIAVEAFGTRVALLAADHLDVTADDGHSLPAERGASWGHIGARVDHSRSIAPGDRVAVKKALLAGERVAAVPFMQRAAVLSRRPVEKTPLGDLPTAALALAAALVTKTPPTAPVTTSMPADQIQNASNRMKDRP